MQTMVDRNTLIGASEVPCILGLDPFCSPLKLWAIKTGEIDKDDLSQNEAVFWGTRLEREVSHVFAEKHGVKVIAYKKRYVHPDYEWFSCELDNIIAGTEELCEIKTVNAWAWKEWANPDELPAKVIIQVMTQLGLSNRKVGWVACLCGGQKYIEKRVEFDQQLYDDIVKKVVAFWDMVQTKTPPVAVGLDNDFIVEIHPNSNEQIQACEEMNTDIARRQELCMHLAEIEKQKDEIEARIKQVIGNNLGIKTSKYSVTWKPQARVSVDSEKLKTDGIYENYTKKTTNRVLRVAIAKG